VVDVFDIFVCGLYLEKRKIRESILAAADVQ